MKISGATAPVTLGWIFMVAPAATSNNSDRTLIDVSPLHDAGLHVMILQEKGSGAVIYLMEKKREEVRRRSHSLCLGRANLTLRTLLLVVPGK